MSWASGITRSVDTPYGGLLIPTSADKKAGRAFVKFAAKLFSERAGHASARVDEEGIDRANSPVVQAEPGESGRISEESPIGRVLLEREAPRRTGRFFWGVTPAMRELRRKVAALAPTPMRCS